MKRVQCSRSVQSEVRTAVKGDTSTHKEGIQWTIHAYTDKTDDSAGISKDPVTAAQSMTVHASLAMDTLSYCLYNMHDPFPIFYYTL